MVYETPETREAAPSGTASTRQDAGRTRTRKTQDSKNQEALPLPHDLDAERALLGAAMLSVEALEVLATKTEPHDYYKSAHGTICAALRLAYEEGITADVVTVADIIRRDGDIDSIGGTGTLLSLMAEAPSSSNAARYAQIIHDHATLRRLHAKTSAVMDAIRNGADAHELVERAQASMAEVASQNGSRTFSSLDMPNMTDLMSGNLVLEQPDYLARSDGQCLFYAGKMHMLQAEASSGKSWITLYAAMEIMQMGGTVIYLDYEDSSRGIATRLLTLGADPKMVAAQFQWVKPTGAMGHTERAELQALIQRMNPELIILDGVAEALSADGYDEDRNPDVVKWFNEYPRWLTQMGCAVVLIDHVTKDKEKRGRNARGAVHKINAIDGATYSVQLDKPFSRHSPGTVSLVIAKDRPSGVGAMGETAATIHFSPSSGGELLKLSVEAPQPKRTTDPWRPTRVMEHVSRELEQGKNTGAHYTAKILADVCGARIKKGLVTEAIGRLLAEGFFTTYRVGSIEYLRLVKPFRDGDTPPEADSVQQVFGGEFEPPEDELARRRADKTRRNYPDDSPSE